MSTASTDPHQDAMDDRVIFLVSKEVKRFLRTCAARDGMELSSWVRSCVIRAARAALDEGPERRELDAACERMIQGSHRGTSGSRRKSRESG